MTDLKKHGIIYILVLIVIILFILTRLFPKVTVMSLMTGENPFASVKPQLAGQQINIEVDFGDERKNYDDINASNAYLALVEAAQREKMEVKIVQAQGGLRVVSVGDYIEGNGKKWRFTVNDEQGDFADQVELKKGDDVVWYFR